MGQLGIMDELFSCFQGLIQYLNNRRGSGISRRGSPERRRRRCQPGCQSRSRVALDGNGGLIVYNDMHGQLHGDLSGIMPRLGRFEKVGAKKLLSMSVAVCLSE
jgi:hypothetical protein